MAAWDVRGDGFAEGPVKTIGLGTGAVVVSAVWSDQDGVCVSIDSGDEVIPARYVLEVAAAAVELSRLPAPTCN